MSASCVFIGRPSSRASERDVEDFFRGYGRIRDIVLKNGFGFVEFDDERDADIAINDLNGKALAGERVILEYSRRGLRERDGDRFRARGRDHYGRGRGDYGRGRGGNNGFGPPWQTPHRLIVENLPTSVSSQDLKDLMRSAGEVTYVDTHKTRPNEAIVCFASRDDLLKAIDQYQGKEIDDREIDLIDDSDRRSRSSSKSRSRSRSRSDSPRQTTRSRIRSRLNTIIKAVGFKMNNLSSVPFSRLPGNIQAEVIEGLDLEEKIKLVNVTSGFRGYLARNGVFGGHVDEIKLRFRRGIHDKNVLRISVRKGGRNIFFPQDRALFRNISSCTRFILYCEFPECTYERRLEEHIEADENAKKVGEWFPNLRLVEKLRVPIGWWSPVLQKVLESFYFKVTKFAAFYYGHFSPECPHWEHLLANHLSICESLFIGNLYGMREVPREIPGMEIEDNPEKRDEILDAFIQRNEKQRNEKFESLLSNISGWRVFSPDRSSKLACYRRKIDVDKEMIMVVQVSGGDIWTDLDCDCVQCQRG